MQKDRNTFINENGDSFYMKNQFILKFILLFIVPLQAI